MCQSHSNSRELRGARALVLLFSLAIALIATGFVSAQTLWTVPGDFPTIQSAIEAATTGDTIEVSGGLYLENLSIVSKDLTIQAVDGPGSTIISGALATLGPSLRSVVNFEDVTGACRLEGFSLEGGQGGPSGGGGIVGVNASPTLVDLIVRGNTTINNQPGAGTRIISGNGPLEVVDCIFENNDGGNGTLSIEGTDEVLVRGSEFRNNVVDFGGGGGVRLSDCSDAEIRSCQFETGDVFLGGGGASVENSTAMFRDCTFFSNGASGFGGAMLLVSSTTAVLDCRFENNAAGSGGAIAVDVGTLTIQRSIFTGNVADGSGGAIVTTLNLDTCTIQNCTFSQNEAAQSGGSLDANFESTFTLENSIFWDEGIDPIVGPGVVNASYCDIEGGYPGLGNIDEDPQFVDPAARNFALLRSSPCIDAGNPASAPDPDGSPADMGATPPPNDFLRGDSNGDGGFDISDALFTLASIFIPFSPPPACPDAADVNDDGGVDVSDAIYTLSGLFVPDSPSPPPPFPDCGQDLEPDALTCPDGSTGC